MEIKDYSNYTDEEIKKLLRNVIITRALNPEESSQVLALAVKLFFETDKKAEDESSNKFKSMSADELRKHAKKYVS